MTKVDISKLPDPKDMSKRDIDETVHRMQNGSTGRIMTTVPFGERKYNLWPRDKKGNLKE